jgi:hypothetical protein
MEIGWGERGESWQRAMDDWVQVPWAMKAVETDAPDDEEILLLQRAATRGKSVKGGTRDARPTRPLPDRVHPEDPVFRAFPLIRKKAGTSWESSDHDDVLYLKSR